MTKTELVSFFTMLFAVMIIVSIVAIIVFWRINTPEKMLAEIHQSMQAYDPRNGFTVPENQKNDCIEWAYGKDWKEIKWNYRSERFRELHPELDPNDFSDATPILLYNRRVSNAYLNRNTISGIEGN